MTASYALIISEPAQLGQSLASCEDRLVETPYGPVSLKLNSKWAVISRSGFQGPYLMAHEYQTAANLTALKLLGLKEVLGLHSSGSLRPSLPPGMLVIPDDWINLYPRCHSTLSGQRRHITPAFSRRVRQNLADAAWKAGARFENGGTYWQASGPRLETKAEIKLMSEFADLVGMGMADEASLAQELDLDYAALCSVDNYANGLSHPHLTDDLIRRQSGQTVAAIAGILEQY